jgi:hypothetical protein
MTIRTTIGSSVVVTSAAVALGAVVFVSSVATAAPLAPGGGNCCDGPHVGVIPINLSPLSTGTASVTVTAANGIFCTGQPHAGCFDSAGCVTITENGMAAGPVTVGTPASGTLASVFCIGATGNGLVDATADLPGPGATALPGTALVHH